jgi:GT2 family glycosyltransferase
MDRTNIIIITFNAPDLELPCINNVVETTSGAYQLTIVNNYPQNRPLGHIWNEEIERDKESKYFCFHNTDCVLPKEWLPRLLEIYKMEDNISGVGGVTNSCASPQRGRTGPEEFKLLSSPVISGFNFIVSRQAFETVGLFDPDFGIYGQEDWWFYMANRIHGLLAYYRTDVFIRHEHGATIKRNPEFNEAERAKGRDLYWSKKAKLDKELEGK